MFGRISVDFDGYVGNDLEVISKKDGGEFAKISIAVNQKEVDETTGKEISKPVWFTVYLNGWYVNYAKSFIKKGDFVSVRGSLKIKQTMKNNVTTISYHVYAEELKQLLIHKVPKNSDTSDGKNEAHENVIHLSEHHDNVIDL